MANTQAGASAANDKSRQPNEAALAAARTDATATARTEERTRVQAIMNAEEAKGREDLAHHFAFDTDMTPEAAKAALGKAPKQAPAGKVSPFEARMNGTPNPAIGPDGAGGSADPDDPEVVGASIVALYRADKKRSA